MNNDLAKRMRFPGWLVPLMFILTLGACATTPSAVTPDSLVQQADAAMKNGSSEQAVDLLNQASKLNPANNDVWVKLAQAQFERQNYPKAIEAGTEALARAPGNAEARSVIFVASMRLAVNSLAEIRADNPISEGSRGEAEQLVKQLRETLGESILVPIGKAATAKPRAPRPAVARSDSAPVAAPAAKPAAAAPAATASNSNDPFGALR